MRYGYTIISFGLMVIAWASLMAVYETGIWWYGIPNVAIAGYMTGFWGAEKEKY